MKRSTFPADTALTNGSLTMVVRHCCHPTALWPYYIQDDEGMILSPNGLAFQTKAVALVAAQLILDGKAVMHRDRHGRRCFGDGKNIHRDWQTINAIVAANGGPRRITQNKTRRIVT